MSSSRREFLKRGTLVALAAGVPLVLSKKVSGMEEGGSSSESDLSLADFKAQLDTTFVLNHQASKVRIKLVNVADLASPKQTASGKECFSLMFRGPQGTRLKQNTYLIEHEKLGTFSFLMVPMRSKDARGQHYEAVVNRLYP